MPPSPLIWDARPQGARAAVLVLHGGAVDGYERNRPWSHNVLRLVPFGRSLASFSTQADLPIAVARLRFGVRGWNGAEQSPVPDTRAALSGIRDAVGDVPVTIIGHSMGGRTALHVADDPNVRTIIGLAPWIDAGDDLGGLRDVSTIFVHGDRDTICPLSMSRKTVLALRASGEEASLVRVAGSDHAMIRRAGLWSKLVNELTTGAIADQLGESFEPSSGVAGTAAARVLAGREAIIDV